MYKKIILCRVCKKKKLIDILKLGNQPLANALIKFKKDLKKEKKVPLELTICKSCKLIQLKHTVKPEILFKNYLWVTGTSKKIKEYRKFFFNKIKKYLNKKNNFICEIASNDGFFLEYIKRDNDVLGIDPAKNLANIANSNGINTLAEFFDVKTSNKVIRLKNKKPNLIICRNVVPHIENIDQVMKGIKNLLSDNGIGVIEFHNAANLINKDHYDYVYHEHIFYFTLNSLTRILKRYNLFAFDCFNSPVSGGSYVVIFKKKKIKKTKNFSTIINKEKSQKLDSLSRWKLLKNKVNKHKKRLIKLLQKYDNSKILVGYGASARSSTLLNYLELGNEKIKKVFDISPYKKNYYTPGSHIKINIPTKKSISNTDALILLAWNFKKEILNFLKKLNYKNDIIEPLPKIKKYKLDK